MPRFLCRSTQFSFSSIASTSSTVSANGLRRTSNTSLSSTVAGSEPASELSLDHAFLFKGFLGALVSPEKSIFLFDPLIVLTLVLALLGWKRFSSSVKAYLVATLFLLFVYTCFYARYYEWSGNFAWGDRYVSSVVEMVAYISVPLLLKFRPQLGKIVWSLGIFLSA